jgi:hypothetical protein
LSSLEAALAAYARLAALALASSLTEPSLWAPLSILSGCCPGPLWPLFPGWNDHHWTPPTPIKTLPPVPRLGPRLDRLDGPSALSGWFLTVPLARQGFPWALEPWLPLSRHPMRLPFPSDALGVMPRLDAPNGRSLTSPLARPDSPRTSEPSLIAPAHSPHSGSC